jgi:hypothetical protein
VLEASIVTIPANWEAEIERCADPLLEPFLERAVTDEDWSDLSREIRNLSDNDLIASHRRVHQLAARQLTLTGFSQADMVHFHALLAAELTRREMNHDSPLSEYRAASSGEEKHFPRTIRRIRERHENRRDHMRDHITDTPNPPTTLTILEEALNNAHTRSRS